MSESSRSSNIALITEGRVFTLYSFNDNLVPRSNTDTAHNDTQQSAARHTLYAHPIHLYYRATDDPLGTLYWSAVSADGIYANNQPATYSLSVHAITDIYIDQQHAEEWNYTHCDNDQDGTYFTLVSEYYRLHLCLRADSAATRAAYLSAIKQLFYDAEQQVTTTANKKKRQSVRERENNAKEVTSSTTDTSVKEQLLSDVASSSASISISAVKEYHQSTQELAALEFTATQKISAPLITIADSETYEAAETETQIEQAAVEPDTDDAADISTEQSDATSVPSTEPVQVLPSIQALMHGFIFRSYSTTAVSNIHVHYDPTVEKLGTLYWQTVDPVSPYTSVPVNKLCDVFLGKQSDPLKSPLAFNADPAACFTIASKDTSLHLCAENEQERDAFLEGIKQVFLRQGKRVAAKKVKTHKKAAISATTPLTQAQVQHIRQQVQQQQQQQQQHEAKEPSLGKQQQKGQHKEQQEEQATLIHKQQQTDTSVVAVDVAPVQKESSVTTATPSSEPVPSSKIAVEISASSLTSPVVASPTSSTAVTVAPPALEISPTASLEELLQTHPALSLLRAGVILHGLFGSDPLPTILVRLFLFYEPLDGKLGTFYWCDPGFSLCVSPFMRPRVTSQSLPLHKFTDVLVGKATPEMKSITAAAVSPAVCFSLVTKARTLNLLADHTQQRKDILEAIKLIFLIADKKFEQEADQQQQQQQESILGKDEEGRSSSTSREQAAAVSSQNEPGEAAVSAGVSSPVSSSSSRSSTLNIFSSSPLCPASPTAATSSSSSLAAVDENAGTRNEDRERESSVPPPPPQVMKLSPLRSLNPLVLLRRGGDFISYTQQPATTSDGDSTNPIITVSPVTLYWQEETTVSAVLSSSSSRRYGQFCVCPVGGRTPIAIYPSFSEILNGKQSKELSHSGATHVPAECCLSLVGSKGSLHLQATTETQRNVWIEAIKTLYTAMNNKATADPFTVLQQQSLHTPDQLLAVKIPLLVQGIGAVLHAPRTAPKPESLVYPPQSRVHIYYDPTVSILGSLYWGREQEKINIDKVRKSTGCCLPIHEVQLIILGHTEMHAVEGGITAPAADTCVSLIGSRTRLDVQFASAVNRQAFLSALHAIMLTQRDLTQYKDETIVVKQGQCKQVVSTPWGVAEVLVPSSRTDGIICATLPWAILYTPATSVNRCIAVFGSHGLGYCLTSTKLPERGALPVCTRTANGQIQTRLILRQDLILIPFMHSSLIDMVRQTIHILNNKVPHTQQQHSSAGNNNYGSGSLTSLSLKRSSTTPPPPPLSTTTILNNFNQLTETSQTELFNEINRQYNRELLNSKRASSNFAAMIHPNSQPPQNSSSSSSGCSTGSNAASSNDEANALSFLPPLPLLRCGHICHMWSISPPNHQPIRTTVLIGLDEVNNSLRWHDVTLTAPVPLQAIQTLRIDHVLRLVKGKQVAVLQTPELITVDDSLCFCILTMSQPLAIEAISAQARDQWIDELNTWMEYRLTSKSSTSSSSTSSAPKHKHARSQRQGSNNNSIPTSLLSNKARWTDQNKRSSNHNFPALGGGGCSDSAAPFVPPSIPVFHRRMASLPRSTLFSLAADPLCQGEYFMSYVESAPFVTTLYLFYDQSSGRLGSIYWCAPEHAAERPTAPACRLPLVSLCDMIIGKADLPAFHTQAAESADSQCCFSLATRKLTLHLEAQNTATREAWIDRIKAIIAGAGKKVIDADINNNNTSVNNNNNMEVNVQST